MCIGFMNGINSEFVSIIRQIELEIKDGVKTDGIYVDIVLIFDF